MNHEHVVHVPLLGILDSIAELENKIRKASPDIVRTAIGTLAPKLAECVGTKVCKAKRLLGNQSTEHQRWSWGIHEHFFVVSMGC